MKDNENLIKFGQEIYSKHPALRPFLSFIKKSFFNRPKFSGWGMTSIHESPWENNNDGKKFLEINKINTIETELDRPINSEPFYEINHITVEQ